MGAADAADDVLAAVTTGERAALENACASLSLLDSIYGLTPAIMYSNFVTAKEKRAGAKRNQTDHYARVRELCAKFNNTPRIKEGWTVLWNLAKRR